jgi:RHS repeat-associated protein
VNSSQTLAASYRYDPYGNTISSSGSLAGANVYRFSSKEIHVNSGLYYYGYRWYHPNLQRWLNRDPISEQGGYNLYTFANNDAANELDENGMLSRFHAEPGNCPGNPVAPIARGPYPIIPPPLTEDVCEVDGAAEYLDCWARCMAKHLGIELAAEAGGKTAAARRYYVHLSGDKRFKHGRSSKVLVPRLANRIGAVLALVTACDAWKCAAECGAFDGISFSSPPPPYSPPYSGGPRNMPPVIAF